jgi:hypothetical protein
MTTQSEREALKVPLPSARPYVFWTKERLGLKPSPTGVTKDLLRFLKLSQMASFYIQRGWGRGSPTTNKTINIAI